MLQQCYRLVKLCYRKDTIVFQTPALECLVWLISIAPFYAAGNLLLATGHWLLAEFIRNEVWFIIQPLRISSINSWRSS